jgi:hypothetical protein
VKNDEQEDNPQPQSSNIESPGSKRRTAGNGHETNEQEREGAGEASGKRTVSSRKIEASPPDQQQRPARKEFHGMP